MRAHRAPGPTHPTGIQVRSRLFHLAWKTSSSLPMLNTMARLPPYPSEQWLARQYFADVARRARGRCTSTHDAAHGAWSGCSRPTYLPTYLRLAVSRQTYLPTFDASRYRPT